MLAPAPTPRLIAPPAPGGWDSHVFVLAGGDCGDLRDRAAGLAARLDGEPDVDLGDLAAGLAVDLGPGGVRLAVVATDAADLRAKLGRAAGRLADPGCRRVHDAAGVYFEGQPLYPGGSVALLFPGEGAQYPGMLADLCGVFPDVEETFAWCDELAAGAGRPSLRGVLHPAAGDRAAAEAELRKVGPSILGVLVADLAVTRVLRRLNLPVAAVAGHSAGELAALHFAGALEAERELGARLVDAMPLMQYQEDAAGGPDALLLAVGAGRTAVEAVAAEVAGGAVVVAMDNCPHQCVAVGPASAVAAVEAVLSARGLVCERLPFRRPYHTPLFEPWMGPFRDLFGPIPFRSPHTPVYSCSTGARFPADPAAIRDIAVNQWVRPVEFVRTVEALYADGVRVFVEAGPRGNLSAFVEDVLRGRPFAAIPANVPRKSGPTQINHLVARLAVHGVPVDFAPLFGPRPTPTCTRPGAAIMGAYLAAMERFLDVQREVMQAFLAGHPAGPPAAAPAPAKPLCLVGDIVAFDPGRSVVFRRALDGREDVYADDHTLGGRGVSRVDPGQNGLPVLPMTFSLEAVAQAACLLAPGKIVVAIRDVRLHRWLPFDADPTTLEVRAAVTAHDPATGRVEVRADVRDLGNSFLPGGADKPSAEATVVLADHYPDPPAPAAFALTDEAPCRLTVADLRRNMFHGPLFQMIRTLDRFGREGIEGTLEVQGRGGWFRSDPDPAVVLDPVLVDAAMHILGAWHLEQPDQSGRIFLPVGVRSLELFGPPPPAGSRLVVRGHNEAETARQVRHGLDVFAPDGRLWLRMLGAAYWRFYLPFGEVNFFGPKDEYFLSSRLPAAEAAAPGGRCHVFDPPADLQQPVLRASAARVTMTPRELGAFAALDGPDAGRSDWLFSRLVAKDAVRAAWHHKYGVGTFPADIETDVTDGRFACRPRGEAGPEPLPAVAVAVAGGTVAAFAAFTNEVGVGVVVINKGEPDADALAHAVRLAVADALRVPAGDWPVTPGPQAGSYVVGVNSRKLRVRAGRHGAAVVATTVCEAASE